MTAEVAVLNKLAVALAADSTVTISTALEKHKTFESADKLFELSATQPIGVMFYGNGQFMDLPISVLIKQFRSEGRFFQTVAEAKSAFLKYLCKYGKAAPQSIRHFAVLVQVAPIFDDLLKKANEEFREFLIKGIVDKTSRSDDDESAELILLRYLRKVVLSEIKRLESRPNASFEGGKAPDRLTNQLKTELSKHPIFSQSDDGLKVHLNRLALLIIRKQSYSGQVMGLVFAGFGERELLPSLHSCVVHGFLRQRLKYVDAEDCDIDREGSSAAVFGFAQRDVMERFLYGFDDFTKAKVTEFSENVFGEAANAVLEVLDGENVDPDLVEALRERLNKATKAYSTGLEEKCFSAISGKGRQDIEDMIRFMPKPDLAEMAESLVNLTSIRRRVSKGMETVGGPVDVAVISKAEGFIWVKRKHYFDQNLNHRFFFRNRSKYHPLDNHEVNEGVAHDS